VQIEFAVPPGESGAALSQRFLREIELRVQAGRTYRGKILSLESEGHSGAVRAHVHRLRSVRREDVILPDATLALLDRNITGFVQQRAKLRSFGLSAKKGVLFHGPPGTGKTHTLHYLAAQLPGHTTVLITAEQVGLLGEYLRVARLLQPSLVVLEDVDLIARARQRMRSGCEESLLNFLLNEMDGLRQDAEVIFILTTNRPEDLEEAIAARPGRIDQAIEFPLPDDTGRTKLTHLYRAGLDIGEDLIALIVGRTRGCSGAFIKELMRRTAQYLLEDNATVVTARHVESALEEMTFAGGLLNRKLLGFSATSA
jgi:ATP-dependent 26S proteasome regulatory subunit